MVETLVTAGFGESAIRHHIEAHKNHGWLRPQTPLDILALAEIHYTLPPASGFAPLIPAPPRQSVSKVRHVRKF